MTSNFRTALAVLAIIGGSLASFVASAQDARVATITFERPTKYVDDTNIPASVVVTYKLFQGAKGGTKAHVADINGSPVTVNTGLQPGETCWHVVAVANGVESAPSNEGCKTFAFPATEAVTITVR